MFAALLARLGGAEAIEALRVGTARFTARVTSRARLICCV